MLGPKLADTMVNASVKRGCTWGDVRVIICWASARLGLGGVNALIRTLDCLPKVVSGGINGCRTN